jgi:23S rRNA (uridine2552-2'-O)-methyltransferase|tara:strand:- start:2618 stop:3235 length:618 start_codon:yes stop_codon:yes gene_type:complete
LKKNRISKNWLIKKHKDQFFKQSKIQGYRSRSAFKLMEMDQKFKFLYKNTNLLDLGSVPGGWSQVAAKKITKGKILAVDVKPMKKIENVDFLKGDLFDNKILKKIYAYFGKKIDVVVSDMATNTSGNKSLDSYRTGELCLKGMNLAQKILHKNGIFLSKVFMGSIFVEINKKANESFKNVIKYKPLSSRRESKEIYIYCSGIKVL